MFGQILQHRWKSFNVLISFRTKMLWSDANATIIQYNQLTEYISSEIFFITSKLFLQKHQERLQNNSFLKLWSLWQSCTQHLWTCFPGLHILCNNLIHQFCSFNDLDCSSFFWLRCSNASKTQKSQVHSWIWICLWEYLLSQSCPGTPSMVEGKT